MARGDSAYRIGLGRNLQYPVEGAGSGSLVDNTLVTGFQILKIGDVFACSTATTGQIAEQMTRRDSAHQISTGRDLQCPIDGAGKGSLVGNTLVTGFQIPKIGDIFGCSTATTGQITKRMARGDSAH